MLAQASADPGSAVSSGTRRRRGSPCLAQPFRPTLTLLTRVRERPRRLGPTYRASVWRGLPAAGWQCPTARALVPIRRRPLPSGPSLLESPLFERLLHTRSPHRAPIGVTLHAGGNRHAGFILASA